MNTLFSRQAGEDYLHWKRYDPGIARRIDELLEEIARSPLEGAGKPLALRHALSGYGSRRIAGEHRLVYRLEAEQGVVRVVQCRHHHE